MRNSNRSVQGRAAAKRKRAFGAGVFACAVLGAGVVTSVATKYESLSGVQPQPQAGAAAAPAAPAPGYVTVEVGGKKLQVNAKTLQQGPLTQEQADQLADALKENKSTDGLVEVRHDDGSVSVNLEDRFENVTMAKRNDDGSVSAACVDTPEAARGFLNSRDKTGTVAGAPRKAADRE